MTSPSTLTPPAQDPPDLAADPPTPGGQVTPSPQAPRVVLDPAARVSRTDGPDGPALLVRQGERVHRLGGNAAVQAVSALLTLAEAGQVPLGPLDAVAPAQALAVEQLLARLVEAGLLASADEAAGVAEATPGERGLWLRSGRTVAPVTVRERLTGTTVSTVGTSPLAARIAQELASAGATTARRATAADVTALGEAGFVVAVGTHADDPLLAEWNTRALETGTPWLQVLPHDGRRAAVGPFMVPGSSACHECFRLRRAANFPDRRLVPELVASTPLPVEPLPATQPGLELVLAGLVVDKVLERVGLRDRAGSTAPGAVSVLEVSGDGVRLQEHRVLRVPRCPACWPGADRGLPQVWFHGDGA